MTGEVADIQNTELETVDCVVVGAGVVGLACARAMALAGRQVLILEAANAFGTGASSRNSEVIHAGLYYPAGSLKARLCVRGRHLLYAYSRERGIAHRQCGKLVVATSAAQLAALDGIHAQALANGVDDVRLIGACEARSMEPALACFAALLSPSTGIIDSHGLMLSLLGDAENAGAMLVLQTPVVSADHANGRIVLGCGGDAPMRLAATTVINAAGLFSTLLAARLPRLQSAALPSSHFAKGNYFSFSGRSPFSHLIYPVPGPGGLGVHLTLDLQGRGRFGPDVEWLDDPSGDASPQPGGVPLEYVVNPARMKDFEAEIRRYWPDLPPNALAPDYAGIRAKIAGPGEPAADFVVEDESIHGTPGLVNLLGIESPGLTSALAIAEVVAARLH